jgi:type I restriction enzyme S subunit
MTDEEWRQVRFSEVAESVTERVDDPTTAGVHAYVGLDHLDPDTLKISRWGSPTDVEATKLRFYPGDVIYARRRAYQRKLGVAEFEGICSAHALVLRAHPDVCLPEFLPYFLQSDQFHERALDISVGSLSPTINWKTLAVQKFALPPVAEQRKVVELLGQCDEVIAKYSCACVAGRSLTEAFRIHIAQVGEVHSLLELAGPGGIQIGPFGSQLHAEEYTETGIPVVMPSDLRSDGLDASNIRRVTESTAERLSQHRLQPGDIVLPRRGELDKRASVGEAEQGWLCGTGSVRIRLREPENATLVVQMLSAREAVRWLSDNAVGTTMPNLNSAIVGRIPLRLPQSSERAAWAARLRGVLSTISLAESTMAEAKRVRTELLRTYCARRSDVQ